MCPDCLLVISKDEKLEHFAQEGDSGALVIYHESGTCQAIGLISKVVYLLKCFI